MSGAPARDDLPPLPAPLLVERIGFRLERPGDRAFVRALYGEQRAAELAGAPWPAAAKTAFLDDQFRLQSAHYAERPATERFVLLRGGRKIGRLYLDRSGQLWSLAEIALVADERGRGVGGALVAWLQEAAGIAGAVGIELHVVRDNAAAARFYLRRGFGFGGASATRVRMEWRR